MARSTPADDAAAAVDAERRFVLALGGFALEIAGATFVTHEKIPVARFNYVDAREIGVGRQSAFLERALDHYFQRALRPTFRLPEPVPAHLDRGLRTLGLRPRTPRPTLLLEAPGRRPAASDGIDVRVVSEQDLDAIASFWTAERERPELRTALDIALNHPNPHEELVPVIASIDGTPVSAALVYRYRHAAGIHLVATRPWARGRGAATGLVAGILRQRPTAERVRFSLLTESARGIAHLRTLGFRPARRWIEYALAPEAELAVRPPSPAGPPRWRPPRS